MKITNRKPLPAGMHATPGELIAAAAQDWARATRANTTAATPCPLCVRMGKVLPEKAYWAADACGPLLPDRLRYAADWLAGLKSHLEAAHFVPADQYHPEDLLHAVGRNFAAFQGYEYAPAERGYDLGRPEVWFHAAAYAAAPRWRRRRVMLTQTRNTWIASPELPIWEIDLRNAHQGNVHGFLTGIMAAPGWFDLIDAVCDGARTWDAALTDTLSLMRGTVEVTQQQQQQHA